MRKKSDEIKKGLECHARPGGCDLGCPYVDVCDEYEGCPMSADALALIQQLEKQNRTLTEQRDSYEKRMIDLAQRMPEWISARLPPTKWRHDDQEKTLINFLVYSPEFGVDVANYLAPAKTWLLMGLPVEITHWMDTTSLPVEITHWMDTTSLPVIEEE